MFLIRNVQPKDPMDSLYQSKLTLLEAALSFREDITDHRKKLLFDGIFWLVDELEQEIRAQARGDESYCLSHILELKEEAERCFKQPGAFVAPNVVRSCCAKLISCSPQK